MFFVIKKHVTVFKSVYVFCQKTNEQKITHNVFFWCSCIFGQNMCFAIKHTNTKKLMMCHFGVYIFLDKTHGLRKTYEICFHWACVLQQNMKQLKRHMLR